MAENIIHLVGFGSQGCAWAQCLRNSGWDVRIYLHREGASFRRAQELGFTPSLISTLPKQLANPSQTQWVAMLCPDTSISEIYQQWISDAPARIRLILAHGYVVYARELHLKAPQHQVTLLAPKAIGPKLWQSFQNEFPNTHALVAGISAPDEDREMLIEIARGIGFNRQSLVTATFEEEAIGDLISEQGLLCGGVMNLLVWTMEAMEKAGIPPGLIREECLTELELIAGLIRERGPGRTFSAISQAAQCGTIAMGQRMEASGLKKEFLAQVESIQNRKFAEYFRSDEWRNSAEKFAERLTDWEQRLKPKRIEEPQL